MPHIDWCGRCCASCDTSCALDESMACSPDCPELSADGEPVGETCKICDARSELNVVEEKK